MVYKALLWTCVFWISYIKWYKLHKNNLSVALENKQGETLKLVNPKHKDWASIQLLTLSVLTFLFTLLICQVIFQWKQRKEKVGNALCVWLNFHVDLTFFLFLGVIERIVKVTHFA